MGPWHNNDPTAVLLQTITSSCRDFHVFIFDQVSNLDVLYFLFYFPNASCRCNTSYMNLGLVHFLIYFCMFNKSSCSYLRFVMEQDTNLPGSLVYDSNADLQIRQCWEGQTEWGRIVSNLTSAPGNCTSSDYLPFGKLLHFVAMQDTGNNTRFHKIGVVMLMISRFFSLVLFLGASLFLYITTWHIFISQLSSALQDILGLKKFREFLKGLKLAHNQLAFLLSG